MESLLHSDLIFRVKNILQSLISGLPLDELPFQIEGQLTEEASKILHSAATGFMVVSLVLSLLGCFLGYRLLKFWISMAGLLVGAILGFGITWYFTGNPSYSLIGASVCATLLAFLAYKIYLVGAFLLFGFGSGFLSMACLPFNQEILLCGVSILIGITVAMMAVIYMRPAIIVITGITNGITAMGAIAGLAGLTNQSLILPLGVCLGMFGTAFQFLTTKGRRRPKKKG